MVERRGNTQSISWKTIISLIGAVTALISAVAYLVYGPNKEKIEVQIVSPTAHASGKLGPLTFVVNYLYRPGGRGAPKQMQNGSVLKSGDTYKIVFIPEEDCYAYIYQIDSAGAVFRLFPMEDFKGVHVDNFNPVQANQVYYIPSRMKAFRLDEQKGTERIYFLASREPNNKILTQYREIEQARAMKDARQVRALEATLLEQFRTSQTRGLADIVDEPVAANVPEKYQWNETEGFAIGPQFLPALCLECVGVVEFEHR